MPFRKRLARFNEHVTNRVARRFAGWMPLGLLHVEDFLAMERA